MSFLVELKYFDLSRAKVERAGQKRGSMGGQAECVAVSETRVALHVHVGVARDVYVVAAAECRPVLLVAVDGVLGILDGHPNGLTALVYQAEQVGLVVAFVRRVLVPDGFGVAAEDAAVCCLNECERARSIVALGVKAIGGETVATRSIQELEAIVMRRRRRQVA